MRKTIVSLVALCGGISLGSAAVTVQGWWHLDSTQPITDSSGNSRTFGTAFSTAPNAGGSVAAQLINNGAGGPLGSSGWSSKQCIRLGVGVGGKRQSAMWGIGYNPPAGAYGIEIWVLPQDNGIAGGSGGWIFSSGESGGVAMRINAPSGNPSYIDAFILGTGIPIGNQVLIDTNKWMHLAIVDNAGVLTFYTNGIPCGASLTNAATAPAGDVYIGTPSDNQAYDGYLDEARMFTFAAGAFSTNDLLLRAAGPMILYQPLNASVWSGGAAPFSVTASFDNSQLYQWRRGTTDIGGATGSDYLLPTVAPADSGSTFACKLTGGGISVTSAPAATLTVVPPNASNIAAYRNVVTAEPSLVAYFPVDNCTGSTVTNVVDNSRNHDGALELNASYDGRTDRSFGQRALSLNENADVQIQNNPAFEFGTASSGNGTIEALVYLSQATAQNSAIFSENVDTVAPYYGLFASANGSFLIYTTDTTSLSWPVPGGLIGQFAHVALVIENGVNVTPYVNGQSLGTQVQTAFGSLPGGPAWIGSIGNVATGNRWAGTIDELAVYETALSAATIQNHYTKFHYGTNNAPPTITSQPSSKTMLAGGSPQLVVTVGGALPFGFQWTSNTVPIPGATSSTLTLAQTKPSYSATYSLIITNIFGSTNTQPMVLTFTAPPAGYVGKVMSDNPTAFWRLADTAGPTAVDSAGLYDAIYSTNGVTYTAGGFPGDTGAGARLNGSSGRAVTPAIFSALNPSGPFTIEFWGSLTTYGFYVPISSMDRPARTSGYEYYLDGNSPGYEFHTAEAGGYSLITADNTVPPNGTWTHVVGIWDTTNLYLYVNGQLGNNQIDPPAPAGTDNFTDEGQGQTVFVPNTSFPFYIGCRSDNSHFYNGTLCDIAFYSYALTSTQVTNHWSYGWLPAHVTQSPAGVTNAEFSTITLTPNVTGTPNTYQWYMGSTPLVDSLNSDGSAHYPNDVTNLSLTIAQAHPMADSGQYHLVVSNPVGGDTSGNATVLITAASPPVVASVQALATPNAPPNSAGPSPYLVKVLFNGRIDPFAGAYAIGSTAYPFTVLQDVRAATLGADWREVIVQTTGLTPGQSYTLNVSGVKDQAETVNTLATTNITFRAPLLSQGLLAWDYYYLGSPVNQIANLTGNGIYPNAPTTNWSCSAFDTHQITGTAGDLNNSPVFGALGDYYGDSLSGWITPMISGNYTFYLASDDASELWLSTDADPQHVALVAYELGCCHGFVEQTNGTDTVFTSVPISLQANTPYFIRALHVEGTGGDYVKVAWRVPGDATLAANLQPIPGSFLSSYAPGPVNFTPFVFSGGKLTLSWTGTATLMQSTNVALPLGQWTPVPGNPASPYQITPAAGVPHLFYRLQQ